jgi:FMN phosphatase YigB (HAD superfamily)
LIFALTAERIGCRPDQVLYFDDTEENVVGAEASGLTARLFTDARDCRWVCRQFGLL